MMRRRGRTEKRIEKSKSNKEGANKEKRGKERSKGNKEGANKEKRGREAKGKRRRKRCTRLVRKKKNSLQPSESRR